MAPFNKKVSLWLAGFSLVELLVVISIIATLTAILLPNLMGARDRASDSKKKQEMVAIKNALRLFYNDTQNYPDVSTTADLGTTLASYMPSTQSIGYTYEYARTSNGDGFTLKVTTEATNATENYESQSRCGLGVSEATNYYVCAN